MNYSINNFFEKDECEFVLKYADRVGKKFNYAPTDVWDCKRIPDLEFNKLILDRFKKNYDENGFKLWTPFDSFDIKDVTISLTKYYDDRRLNLHKDATSDLTTVIVLTDNFSDGRFMLSNSPYEINAIKQELKIGQSISFNGSEVYHGVMPVISGIRCALNIWMSETNFRSFNLDNVKTLI